jgi:hypothetical protein
LARAIDGVKERTDAPFGVNPAPTRKTPSSAST